MMKKRYPGLAVLLLAIALAFSPLKGAAAEETTLFVNMTTDDPWTAHMALNYAQQVQSMGHPVVLFLNVRAVRLANKALPDGEADADAKAARQALQAMIANGATVYVCGMCTKKAGMTEADWIDGVKPGGKETIAVQMAASTRTISY